MMVKLHCGTTLRDCEKNDVGYVFNVPIQPVFEHVENVLHEKTQSLSDSFTFEANGAALWD